MSDAILRDYNVKHINYLFKEATDSKSDRSKLCEVW